MANMKGVKNMIGMNIKYLRKKFRYSQESVAEKLQVSRQSVAKWENEETLPDIMKCAELSKLFGITMEMLVMCSIEELEKSDFDAVEGSDEGKYIFGIVKVGERGQMVIPKFARKVFDINPGDRLLVLGDKNKGIAIAKIRGLLSKEAGY